jgi:hypothetical protein
MCVRSVLIPLTQPWAQLRFRMIALLDYQTAHLLICISHDWVRFVLIIPTE